MPGTYTGECNTNINISGNKYIHAIDPEMVVIDGAGKTKLFNVEKNSILNLTNLVLTGGCDNGGNGGVIFSNGSLNIKGCTIHNNNVTIGGIYVDGISNTNTFSFINNKIINNHGLLCAGVYINGSNGIIKNTMFENNSNINPNASSSALIISGQFNVNISNSTFKDNNGSVGAGLRILGSPEDIKNSKTIINNSIFHDNEGSQSGAGLMCMCSDVSVENSKFYNNKIDEKYDPFKFLSNGAGVYTANCELNIKNSEFRNNSALYGSGLCNEKGTNTTI
ncbi:MAG: hypothetical protein LBD03_01365 [Methanobrevibacter sp.]|jgi:hypothetical protein|nr:hypothetical protein [Candidatus Methanovirga procula]